MTSGAVLRPASSQTQRQQVFIKWKRNNIGSYYCSLWLDLLKISTNTLLSFPLKINVDIYFSKYLPHDHVSWAYVILWPPFCINLATAPADWALARVLISPGKLVYTSQNAGGRHHLWEPMQERLTLFVAVLQFEMLTGSLPFQGKDRKETMALILK